MFIDTSLQEVYEKSRQAISTEHYMSKARSTLKQIVRDWTAEGEEERKSCYQKCMKGKHGSINLCYPLFLI